MKPSIKPIGSISETDLNQNDICYNAGMLQYAFGGGSNLGPSNLFFFAAL